MNLPRTRASAKPLAVADLLVVPIIQDEAEIVVARPDDRHHLGELGVQCVAQGLQTLRVREHARFRLAAEAVDEEQELPVARAAQTEERHGRQLDILLGPKALAEEQRAPGS